MQGRVALTPRLRQARIAELVRKRGQVTVEALAERFGASHETIRRDLGTLAESGAVQKVYGGAKLPRRRDEGPFNDRLTRNESAKRMIGAATARLLSAGDTLFMDTGSTTWMCAEEAARIGGLTVITNSARIADVFANGEGRARVFLIGGEFDGDNSETTGPTAIAQIGTFHADHAVVGAAAVDAGAGVMNISFEEAQVARAMVDNADHLIVLADSSKFDRRAAFSVCPLERIDQLVSDREPEGALASALARADVAVRCWKPAARSVKTA